MGMSAGKGGDLNSEINVTPLVDVMLVLLIIFMVTAPMLQTGVELQLPQAEAAVLDDEEGKLILEIGEENGQVVIALGEKRVTPEELDQKIAGAPELYIAADKDLPYGVVLQYMARARKLGVVKLQMLTDPLAETDSATAAEGQPK